jgi:hypothetical protein
MLLLPTTDIAGHGGEWEADEIPSPPSSGHPLHPRHSMEKVEGNTVPPSIESSRLLSPRVLSSLGFSFAFCQQPLQKGTSILLPPLLSVLSERT